MRNRDLAPLLFVALLLAGCGGSSSNHSSGVSPVQSIRSGASDLGKLFSDDGTTRETSLRAAQKSFDAAYAKSPNDPRAAMGYGVSTAALAVGDLLPAFGASSRAASPKDSADAIMLRRLFLGNGVGASLGSKGGTSFGVRAASRAEGAMLADQEASLRKIVARLTDARIEALESNPLTLPLAGGSGLVVKLGTVEGYALRSAVQGALGATDAMLAYGAEETDGDAKFVARFMSPIADGSTIAPASYLPGGAWGKLAADGAARLARVKVEGNAVADDGRLALGRLANRPAGGWLTDLVTVTAAQKTEAMTGFDLLKRALGAGTPVSLMDGVSVNVTLGAFLDYPPADLRAAYPSLQASGGVLRPVAGSVADPTFGGLVAGGVPAPALYGRELGFDADTTLGEVREWAFLPNVLTP